MHEEQTEHANKGKGIWKPFAPGDKVWYRRPENSGGPLDSRWVGPCVVVSREDERGYTIRVKPGKEMAVARSFLKPYVEDKYNKEPVPLYFHRRTVIDEEAHDDEMIVDKILDHKIDAKGDEWYLTQWKGGTPEDATWLKPNAFFHRYNSDFVDYCMSKGISPKVLPYLQRKPTEE